MPLRAKAVAAARFVNGQYAGLQIDADATRAILEQNAGALLNIN